MRIPAFGSLTGRLAKLAAVPIVALVLAACTGQVNHNPTGDAAGPTLFGETSNGVGFPHEVVTTQGIEAAGLYLPVFILAVGVFILIEGLLLFVTWRFRRKDGDTELPVQTHGNNRLEFLWTAIPALIVTGMFIVSTMVLTNVQATTADPDVVVDVEAFRFGWKFDYDNGVQVAGGGREGAPEMVLPVDESIRFRLHAADVIHSFYVPSFFFKRDAIPGRTNQFELTIEEPGVYGGQCAEFCGLAHSDMYFSVRAVEPAEYEAWVNEQGGSLPAPNVLDTDVADTEEALDEAQVDTVEQGSETEGADASPAAEASPAAAASQAGVTLEIEAGVDDKIAFSTSILEAPAGQAVTVELTNDSNVPHDIAFYAGPDADAPQIAASENIEGPGTSTSVSFTTPDSPGDYFFRCELHPLQMTGTLTITP